MGDGTEETLCLTGSSSPGTDFVLKDYYNSHHRAPQSSLDHFDDSEIKANKFGSTMYPENCEVNLPCYNSTGSMVDWGVDAFGIPIIDMEALHSATTGGPIYEFPSPLSVFCGVMRLRAYVMPDDTLVQTEEDFTLMVTWYIEAWTPLIYRTKRKSKGSRSKSRGSRRPWYGRKRRNRR